MPRRNKAGKTWKEHAAPYLTRALKQAAKMWHPVGGKKNKGKLAMLRKKRDDLNRQIKVEREK